LGNSHPKNLAKSSSAKILIFSGSDLVNELYAVSNGSAKADLADQIQKGPNRRAS
jgi:hypothetical protein